MNASRPMAHITYFGLHGVKEIPYGVHMSIVYRTREELAAALVPFFSAGLRANERCIWITAEPLRADDAKAELARAGLDVEELIGRGALVVRDYGDWYAEAGRLMGNEGVDLWFREEERALEEGYAGLRITGNVTFLRPQDWALFMEYESLIQQAFMGRRIVTLCTYSLEQCGASEVLDVMRRHSGTLDRPDHRLADPYRGVIAA